MKWSNNESQAENSRKWANRMVIICHFMWLFGLLGIVGSISEVGHGPFIVSLVLLGGAATLYLLAQVMHIRANTEK